MDSPVLNAPFDAVALAAADTATLKSNLLKQVEHRDGDAMAKKVRFAKETLMPLFAELTKRNPIPDLHQQIPLLKGVWLTVWSTIPFQDILPGRVLHESYQIFNDSGYYANLARYKPGRKAPLLKWISRWLLSYDLMITQSYAVQEQPDADVEGNLDLRTTQDQFWDIRNLYIRQSLRIGSLSFSPDMAQRWFDQTLTAYLQNGQSQQIPSTNPKDKTRINAKQYQQISKARPLLDNLYIDQDFRLVKTQREKSQRPSYTVAVRLT
ncbi:MAG: hypothetical protein VKJ64_15695 [Leptolyngbyaceae bacterium]|nr:hypothetical protein [Leptolyngbyaceae bacterium]